MKPSPDRSICRSEGPDDQVAGAPEDGAQLTSMANELSIPLAQSTTM
jgi:hypothetical protein